jgi:site-specific recombinase XerD
MDIGEAVADYLNDMKHLDKFTLRGYHDRLHTFAGWCKQQCPPVELQHARNGVVHDFLAYLTETRKPHKASQQVLSSYTLQGYVQVIRSFLHWCLADEEYGEYVKRAVVDRVKLPKVENMVKETFSEEELDRLFAVCEQEESEDMKVRARVILALLIDTGVRAAELVTLKLQHITLKPGDPHIKVLGKGSKEREIPIGEKSRRLLQYYIRLCRVKAQPGEALLIGRYHKPLTVSGLEQVLDRLKCWSGLEVPCNPHKFRHTFARMFWLRMQDILALSKFLGHEDISTTMEYLKTLTATEVRYAYRNPPRRLEGLSLLDSLDLKHLRLR